MIPGTMLQQSLKWSRVNDCADRKIRNITKRSRRSGERTRESTMPIQNIANGKRLLIANGIIKNALKNSPN